MEYINTTVNDTYAADLCSWTPGCGVMNERGLGKSTSGIYNIQVFNMCLLNFKSLDLVVIADK